MTVHICPRCQERFNVARGVNDFEHNCNSGDATLDNEDVVVTGDWKDYTGSGIVQPNITMAAGMVNTEFGTEAGVRGADIPEFTDRGHNKNTTRTRQHKEFIKLGDSE